MRVFLTLILILWTLFSIEFISQVSAIDFDAKKEFPNYFVNEQYRNLSPNQIPEGEIKRGRDVLEKALGSIFDRMTLPVVLEGESTAKPVKYFAYINDKFIPKGSDVQVAPSGGVVRSGIGYIYAQIREGLARGITAETTLQSLITSKEPIPAIDIRGVGSDFDLLVISKNPADPVVKKILAFTNSAQEKYDQSRSGKNPLKSAFFALGDVNSYNEQIERATGQGGRTLDFLAFDIKNKRMIEPPNLQYIVNDLIRGQNAYIAPLKVDPENSAKQTIRGMRMSIELPWLVEKDDTQLKKEINELLNRVKNGMNPNAPEFARALEQFAKMSRNARYSGANNRYYRAAPESVDALFAELVKLLSARTGKILLPEYVDSFPLKANQARELNGLPKSALMNQERFIREYTDNGKIYHGTSSLENALSIMRGGLYVSNDVQGKAGLGRGGYAARDISIAQRWKSLGMIFKMTVKNDKVLNILDLAELQSTKEGKEFYRKLALQAEREKRDIHEILGRDYGIDAIVDKPEKTPIVLLQNIDMVELPTGLSPLVEGLQNIVTNAELPMHKRYDAFIQLESLSKFAADSSGVEFKKLPAKDTIALLEWSLADAHRNDIGMREALILQTGSHQDASGLDYILKKIATRPERHIQAAAISVIHLHPPERILPYLPELLSSSSDENYGEIVRYLAEKKIDRPELAQMIKSRLALLENKKLDMARVWAGLIPSAESRAEAIKAAERLLKKSDVTPDVVEAIFEKFIPTIPKDDELVKMLDNIIRSGQGDFASTETTRQIRQSAIHMLSEIKSSAASQALLDSLPWLSKNDAEFAFNDLRKRDPKFIENNLMNLVSNTATKDYIVKEYLEKKIIPVKDPRYLELAKKAAENSQGETAARIYKVILAIDDPEALNFVLTAANNKKNPAIRQSAAAALKGSPQILKSQSTNLLLQAAAGSEVNIATLALCFDDPTCKINSQEIEKAARRILEGSISYDPDIAKVFKLVARQKDSENLKLLADVVIKSPWGGNSIIPAMQALKTVEPSISLPYFNRIIDETSFASLQKFTNQLFVHEGIPPEDPRYTHLLEKIQAKAPERGADEFKNQIKQLLAHSARLGAKACGDLYKLIPIQ
jgi:hypothetical protein